MSIIKTNNRLKIGILGGSFNPPHYGHVNISLAAAKQLGLHQVWWIVAKQNPFKPPYKYDFATRMKLCHKITKHHHKIRISDYENKLRSRQSADLLKCLQQNFSEYQFVWIMGSDILAHLHLWQNWQRIMQETLCYIYERQPHFYRHCRQPSINFRQFANRYLPFDQQKSQMYSGNNKILLARKRPIRMSSTLLRS